VAVYWSVGSTAWLSLFLTPASDIPHAEPLPPVAAAPPEGGDEQVRWPPVWMMPPGRRYYEGLYRELRCIRHPGFRRSALETPISPRDSMQPFRAFAPEG